MTDHTTETDSTTIPPRPPVNHGQRMFMLLLTVFEIGASVLVVRYVKAHGGSDFSAYMWSLIPPVIGGLVYWLKTRHSSGASLAILGFNLLSAGVAYFGSHDSKVLLYKDCAVTGIIGLLFAGSLLLPRPLIYWLGQRFATDGTPASLNWWESLWGYQRYRTLFRGMTAIWAVVMLVEAGAKALTIAHTSFQNGYLASQVIPLGATFVGIALTLLLAKRMNIGRDVQR